MPAGYSGTPLVKKLGIKGGFKIHLINPPQNYFDLIGELPAGAQISTALEGQFDFIHFFTKNLAELTTYFPKCKEHLTPTGMVWVSWPKKASKVPTEVDESITRKIGLNTGLVDIKICAVDEIWSGLKFVIRVKDR